MYYSKMYSICKVYECVLLRTVRTAFYLYVCIVSVCNKYMYVHMCVLCGIPYACVQVVGENDRVLVFSDGSLLSMMAVDIGAGKVCCLLLLLLLLLCISVCVFHCVFLLVYIGHHGRMCPI